MGTIYHGIDRGYERCECDCEEQMPRTIGSSRRNVPEEFVKEICVRATQVLQPNSNKDFGIIRALLKSAIESNLHRLLREYENYVADEIADRLVCDLGLTETNGKTKVDYDHGVHAKLATLASLISYKSKTGGLNTFVSGYDIEQLNEKFGMKIPVPEKKKINQVKLGTMEKPVPLKKLKKKRREPELAKRA